MTVLDFIEDEYKIEKPIRLIELFAGVGSQAMALRNLGADFEHYRVVEFDKFAIASYNAIHGTDFHVMDITETKGEDLGIEETDRYEYILTYSFPCQDLSVAGAGAGMARGSGTRSGLLWEVERLLNEVENLPQVLLMENVPQVIGKKHIKHFHEWQAFLESKGYVNYTEKLNAKHYGVAQNRNRVFMVSILGGGGYSFPKPIPLEKAIVDYLEDEVEEKFYVKTEKAQKLIDRLIERGGLEEDRVGVDASVNAPKSREIANCVLAKDRGISNQEQTGNMVLEKTPHQEPMIVASVKDNLVLEPQYRIRRLTPLECWRLMGFTDEDFYKAQAVNSNTQLYKQAGNSIVVDVLEGIFGRLFGGKCDCFHGRKL